MRKILTLMIALVCSIGMWADELYLVGDATPIGWAYGGRDATQMTESEGVYTWKGVLKKGGFKICTAQETWDGYHPQTADLKIDATGATQTMTTDNSADYKWSVINPGIYVVTVSLSANTISITPDWREISSADELIAFAESVNSADENNPEGARWVRLTDNIDMSDKTFPGIGRDSKWQRYHGTFDGQGYVISNLKMTSDCCALITVATGGSVIKNLLIDETCEFNGTGRNAAFISASNYTDFGNTVTIENCGNEANVTGSGNNCAGIHGCNYDGGITITIKNCFNTGTVSSTGNESAPISGWLSNNARIENTWNIGEISDANGNNSFARWSSGSYENCYTTLDWGSSVEGKTVGYDKINVSSGSLCYVLNGNVSGSEKWVQTLPGDSHPYPGVFAGHNKVYANGTFYCDGVTPKGGDVVLSNDESKPVIDPHAFGEDGVCTVCLAAGEEATETDGAYQLTNAGKLLWWSQYVNAGHTDANAVLTTDVDLTGAKYTPIGNTDNIYAGHFDGQGHSVTLALNNPDKDYQGLFGVVTDGVKIEKVIVKGSVTGKSFVGGIVGGTNGGSSNAKKTDIWYCGNEATITAAGANGAGIIGVNMNGSASIILTNCYNTGNITSGKEAGAMSGWLGGGWSSVRNCYNSGTVKNGEDVSKAFGRNSGCYFTNCYYTATSGTDNSTENTSNGTPAQVTDAAVASGELAYKLGEAFHQVIGEGYPVLDESLPNVYEIAVSDAGFATFVPKKNIAAIPAGVEAFAAQIGAHEVGSVYLAPVEELPADNAVIVKAAKGSYFCNSTESVRKIGITNDLTFSNEEETADGSQYILAKPEGEEVGFYQATTGKIAARKGYLVSNATVKAFYFAEEGETAIENVNVNGNGNNGAIFNIAGQKLSKLQKGINIVNGKKVLK
jgi:hypothetical protein